MFLLVSAGTPVQGAVTLSTLVSFNGTNGTSPSELVLGKDGNLYGTTTYGGSSDSGTLFRCDTNGGLTTLFSFNGTNGSAPLGLTQAADGSFYGTTLHGGDYGLGTLYQLTTNGALHTFLSFNGTNGSQPYSALVLNPADGSFYGTTLTGGTNGDNGTVYRLTPGGTFTSLVSFNGSNGSLPYGQLALGADGNFYGSTFFGGTNNNNNGTVFRLSVAGAGLTSLFSFDRRADGANPFAGLLPAADGTLYGTTTAGAGGAGTIFQITTNGLLTTLFAFNGTNGATPYGRLAQVPDGTLYGTTVFGGTNGNNGTVFQWATNNGGFTSLYSFGHTNTPTEGISPFVGLVQASNGLFYGLTYSGGANGNFGTLFQLALTPDRPLQSPMLTLSASGASLLFSWNSVPGQTYQLQSTITQSWGNWTNNGLPITAVGTNTTASETASNTQNFYRLLVSP